MKVVIGDIVEDCSLMPGVVMKVNGDNIEIRRLDLDGYINNKFSSCSLNHCGIVKINAEEALLRLNIGKEQLSEYYRESTSYEDYITKLNNHKS